jgi:hypothetical protein
MVRTDSHQLREAAGDSPEAAGIMVLARAHKTTIWNRTRESQRLRNQLLQYYPAPLEAFTDLDAPDVLKLLAKAPDPAQARKLTRAQVSAAMKRAGRRDIHGKATAVLAALRSEQLSQPPVLAGAYAATVRSLAALITALNEQVKVLEEQVKDHFGRHPDAEIITSQPGMGMILGARCSQSSATTPSLTATARAAGTTPRPARSPAPQASGRSSPPATCTTTGSSTHSTPSPSPRSAPRPAPAPVTTSCAPAASATTMPSAAWQTSSSASSTAASKPAPFYNEDTAWNHQHQQAA